MMIPTTSNPNKEMSSHTEAVASNTNLASQSVLDKKLQAMRELKTEQELNAWKIGELVNDILDQELWRAEGFRSGEHCLERKFKEIASCRTLLRYAELAKRFSQEDVRRFGTSRLDALLDHETQTGQQVSTVNLGEQELRLKQADGSEKVKKFKDCSAQEILRSNTRRKPAQTEESKPDTGHEGTRAKLLLAGTGALLLVVAELLPSWEVTGVLSVIGGTLLFIGGVQLIRRGFKWLQSFIRSGQAIDVLASVPSKLTALGRNVVRGLRWTWSFVRSGQILHALAKLPSRASSLGGAVVGRLHRLVSFLRKQNIDKTSKAQSKLPSPMTVSDMSSPPVNKPPSPAPQTGDGNTKVAA